MSYYGNRRYNPPADVYAASTLIGPHTGKNAWTPLSGNPAISADLQQFRADRSSSPAAESVREDLGMECDTCAGAGRVERLVLVDRSGCYDRIGECCDACEGTGRQA